MKYFVAFALLSIALVACGSDPKDVNNQSAIGSRDALAEVTAAENNLPSAGCEYGKKLVSHSDSSDEYELTISCSRAPLTLEGLDAADAVLTAWEKAIRNALAQEGLTLNQRNELNVKLDLVTKKETAIRDARRNLALVDGSGNHS